jgi:hypothetical protein
MNKILFAGLSLLICGSAFGQDATVDYPADYRTWQHVKSMVIQKGHPLYETFGGIHHLYANEKAVQGYQKGTFPDGSVIVFDLLEAPAQNNAITEGKRKLIGVMEKDAGQFAATGSWGFEGFGGGDPKNRLVKNKAAEACFQCHSAQKKNDYVFSRWRK